MDQFYTYLVTFQCYIKAGKTHWIDLMTGSTTLEVLTTSDGFLYQFPT